MVSSMSVVSTLTDHVLEGDPDALGGEVRQAVGESLDGLAGHLAAWGQRVRAAGGRGRSRAS